MYELEMKKKRNGIMFAGEKKEATQIYRCGRREMRRTDKDEDKQKLRFSPTIRDERDLEN